MKVVIDTNVIISGLFWSGTPKVIIENLINHSFKLFVTPNILEEYKDLVNRFGITANQSATAIFNFILTNSHIVMPTKLTEQICEDKDDDIFIAAALACKADYLITGDKLLLASASKVNLQIIKPRTFVAILSTI